MKDPRTNFQHVNDLKDDELEHGARQGEVNTENELDKIVPQLIIFK